MNWCGSRNRWIHAIFTHFWLTLKRPYSSTEEIVTEEGGGVSTTNMGDYKLPNIKDAPVMKTVVVELPNGSGPYGSMSIGESAVIPTAAAIANAVQDAVGVRIKSLPITAEKISAALRRLIADS